MSDPIEQSDPVWFAALRRAHLWCELNACDQDEKSNGHRATPRGCLLGCGPDRRSGDTTGRRGAVTRVLGQSMRLEAILPNARDAVCCYPNAAHAHEMATVLLAGAEVIDGPVQSPLETNKHGWSVPRAACVDCGQCFHADSSPHMDRCWECAERDDEESGR